MDKIDTDYAIIRLNFSRFANRDFAPLILQARSSLRDEVTMARPVHTISCDLL